MHRLAAVQYVECAEDSRNFSAHETLRLWPFLLQPHTQVAVHGVLQRDAVPRSPVLDFGEPVVHTQRARLAEQQLGEVCLAEPRRESFRNLDADLRR